MLLVIYVLLNDPNPDVKLLEQLTKSFKFGSSISMIVYECVRLLYREYPQLSFLKLLDRQVLESCHRKRKFQGYIPHILEVLRRVDKGGGFIGPSNS